MTDLSISILLALLAAFFAAGIVKGVALLALAVAPALIGMWARQYIRQAVTPARFKRCFLTALASLGTEMMLRGIW